MDHLTKLYLDLMECPKCKKRNLLLSTMNTLLCKDYGHQITPEDRFLFLEKWTEDLLSVTLETPVTP